MTSSFSFRAQVAAEAIEKVGRLFNASIDDILRELLQNARRAGASKIMIDQIDDPHFGRAIRIADDGAGLDDPRALFSLGHSDWSEELSHSEDAAGMGFFSLANRGASIIAQEKDTENAWIIRATPAAFHGRERITVSSGPNGHRGVSVIFPILDGEKLDRTVRRATQYFPVPVIFDGERMESEDFLADAEYVECWRGIRIGVSQYDLRSLDHENANFHGVTLRMPLPSLQQCWHSSYQVCIDVIDCAHLKLVLPARKEVVRDEMYEALLEEINRIYFRLVASQHSHSLSYKDYKRGRAMGVDIPEASPILRPFSPSVAEADNGVLLEPVSVPPNAYLIEGNGPIEEQTFARAVAKLDDVPELFEPDSRFSGYQWYDCLPRVEIKKYKKYVGGIAEVIDPFATTPAKGRPDRLEIEMDIVNGDASRKWVLETDLIIAGPEYGTLDDMNIQITGGSTITPAELETFLTDALFCYSDDIDAGSYQQQQEWFSDEAEDLSITLLESRDNADLNAIERIVRRELVWRLPKYASVTINIDNRNILIKGLLTSDQLADGVQTHGET